MDVKRRPCRCYATKQSCLLNLNFPCFEQTNVRPIKLSEINYKTLIKSSIKDIGRQAVIMEVCTREKAGRNAEEKMVGIVRGDIREKAQ